MRVSAFVWAASFAAGCIAPAVAAPADRCAAVVAQAGLDAIERTRPIGQTHVFGSPFAFTPSLQRVEVDVAGPQTLIYEVDVTIDASCKVLATSARLESGSSLMR